MVNESQNNGVDARFRSRTRSAAIESGSRKLNWEVDWRTAAASKLILDGSKLLAVAAHTVDLYKSF